MRKIQSLQTLRFIAISLVFLSHCTFIAHPQGGALFNMAGAFGVSLFICLSGFLTYYAASGRKQPALVEQRARNSATAEQRARHSATTQQRAPQHAMAGQARPERPERTALRAQALAFFRKVGKFYPLHVITFVAAIPLVVVAVVGSADALNQIWIGALNLALLQSWVPKSQVFFSFNAVSWYLSTFLLMIALSPALVGLAKRVAGLRRSSPAAKARANALRSNAAPEPGSGRGSTRAALLIAVIFAIELAAALALNDSPLAQWILYVFPPMRLLDYFAGMLCGVIFAEFARGARPSFKAKILLGGVIGAGLAALGIAYAAWRGLQTPMLFYSAAWVVPSNLLILFFAAFDETAPLRARLLVFLGNISMEFFLIHQLVLRYAKFWFDTAAQPLLFAIACYLIAWLLAYAAHRALSGRRGNRT